MRVNIIKSIKNQYNAFVNMMLIVASFITRSDGFKTHRYMKLFRAKIAHLY